MNLALNFVAFLEVLIFIGWMGSCCCGQAIDTQEWSIPAAGNVYRTEPDPSHGSIGRDGILAWQAANEIYSFYFHVDRPSELQVELEARSAEGESQLKITMGGEDFSPTIRGGKLTAHAVGTVSVKEAGYARVDLQGVKRAGQSYGEVNGLIVRSVTEGLQLTCVATNEGNMFYWGRRGPSVHLRYEVPPAVDVEYAYSEILVAAGDDPLGSYFMANGFGEGYFGIQVNSKQERRVLFSVWSPFQTDNPREIPADQKIELLAHGPEVNTGEFGNEGSGGQSFLIYPWKSGRTYRFLTQVKPDGNDNTIYTSWFGDKEKDEWRLIASFRRPKTNTHLKGFHSFLENFNPQTGHQTRQGQHQNVWVRDTAGKWHECLSARFSVDATGGGRHRLDFDGGVEGDAFYLRNCGFFADKANPGETFTRTSRSTDQPQIDISKLPR